MATCKDCVHCGICRCDVYFVVENENIKEIQIQNANNVENKCEHFKNKADVIELPCKVGDTVYYIAGNKVYKSKCHAITLQPSLQIHLYDYDGDNARYSTKDVYRTCEEATQALKARAAE